MIMDILRFIETKRDGRTHGSGEIRDFTERFAAGEVAEYQAAAWLMAVYLKGLHDEELKEFTLALARSGDILSFGDEFPIVDKHSTGGVGDKVTLALVPLVAACGIHVAKLSGPGLGFTGGTVDKLEAIPGFRTHLAPEEFMTQVRGVGCAISGHSAKLAPAEGKFYALRDVTATVPSLPLICSSIVSKKIAGGAQGFVFDVKCGSGAFMRTYKEAEELASALVRLSKALGRKSMALVTDMDQPLGLWVGNAVELLEAIHVLRGEGPSDVKEIVVALAAAMVALGRGISCEEARGETADRLGDGAALAKFKEMVEAQGGDGRVATAPEKYLAIAERRAEVLSPRAGIITHVDARSIGEGVKRLGGGRMALSDRIDRSVGIRLARKKGAFVQAQEPLLEIRFSDERKLTEALPYFQGAFSVEEGAVGGTAPSNGQKEGPILGTVQ